jgi:predicted DCC family thiol-disulfide oxidoreductase YuxK
MHSTTGVVGQITDPAGSRPPGADEDEGVVSPSTFLYDGDCAFCSASARVIMRQLDRTGRSDRPLVLPWQRADLVALGLTAAECDQAVQWVAGSGTPDRVVLAGPAAIGEVLRYGGPLWRVAGRVLRLPPMTALAWPIYRLIARHRDRMPGGTAACALPQADRPVVGR